MLEKKTIEAPKEQPLDTSGLKKDLELTKKETPQMRVVNLSVQTCCGCGCYGEDVQRTVPVDSPLQDGDTVDHMEDDDVIL